MSRTPLRRTAVAAVAIATALGLGVPQALAQPADSSASYGALALPTGSADLDAISGTLSADNLSLLDGALNSPGGISLDGLTQLTEALGPDAQGALDALLVENGAEPTFTADAAALIEGEEKAEFGDRTEREDFITPTVVVGCGPLGSPITLGQTTVQPGPHWGLLTPTIPGGHARFATIVLNDGYNFDTSSSDLKVLWINVSSFRGGIGTLDNKGLLGLPTPDYSTTEETGDGSVIAAVFGRVHYNLPTEESCLVLPTIGSTRVSS